MKNLLPPAWGLMCLFALNSGLAAGPDNTDDWDISFSGSYRVRFQTMEHPLRTGLTGSDQGLQFRTLGKWQADHGPLTLVAEFQDSRTDLNDSGSYLNTLDINALGPLQLYAAWNTNHLKTRAGLFTMGYGNQRLVGRHGFRNTIQNFAGLQTEWLPEEGKSLSAFWVMPVRIKPDAPDGLEKNRIKLDKADETLQLFGLYYTTVLPWHKLSLETYLFRLQESDKADKARTADRSLYTPGLRLVKSPAVKQWDIEIETIYQWGERYGSTRPEDTMALDVASSFIHAGLGYTFNTPWQPHLQVSWDRGSGDKQPGDMDFERFDNLFGPRREYGPTSIYGILGRSNTNSTQLRLEIKTSAKTDAMVAVRRNRLVSATDSFSSSGIRDASGLSGNDAGYQAEFRFRHWLKKDIFRLEAGGVKHFNGDFFTLAPNATHEGDPVYFYTDLTLLF